jgi:hypothetical protein
MPTVTKDRLRPWLPLAALLFHAVNGLAQVGGAPMWRASRDLFISASAESLDHPIPPLVTPNGTIFIADNENGMVSTYDTAGRRLSRAGSKGRGPGELPTFSLMRGSVGDSAWFADVTYLHRVVIYSPRGKPIRTLALPLTIHLPGGDQSRVLGNVIPLSLLANGRMIVQARPRAATARVGSETTHTVLIDSSGVLTKILGTANDSLQQVRVFRGARYDMFAVPFSFSNLVKSAAAGEFIVLVNGRNARNRADTIQVTVLRPNGDTVYSLPLIIATTPIPDETFARARDARLAQARASGIENEIRKGFLAKMPRTYPVVTDAIITSDGLVWLRLHPNAGSVTYMAISSHGRVEGTVSLPSSAVVFHGRGDHVWTLETDNDGFRNVVRYKLTK